MTAKNDDNRTLGIALAVGAAACLLYAAMSRHWLVNGHGNMMFGLRALSTCGGGPCETQSNAAFVDMIKADGGQTAELASNAFAPMGWATTITCLLAALGLLGAAALAISNKRPNLAMSPSTVALLAVMAGLITGCVFIASKPGEPGFVGVGVAFWLFGVGSVAGIASAQLLAKVNRPPDPDLMDGAMNPDQF
jgi:hypothetical protein